ncbi:hypothetical protein [Paraburkholderia phenoliruptrix]|uniref:Uncharacterized protein n=1 Tax=Paraburkholderia phenoliruptrix TaxID=252970 RepID=A0ABV3WL18_9BURK
MGIDMQILHSGFTWTMQIESEAAAQLVRLERFGRTIAGCHLTLDAIYTQASKESDGSWVHLIDTTVHVCTFDACLDLVLRTGQLKPLAHRQNLDPVEAIRSVFDGAERFLQRIAGRRSTSDSL